MPISIQAALKRKLTPIELRIKDILDSAPKGELYRTDELMAKVGCIRQSLYNSAAALDGYSVRHGQDRFFGKPATIADFKKQAGVK